MVFSMRSLRFLACLMLFGLVQGQDAFSPKEIRSSANGVISWAKGVISSTDGSDDTKGPRQWVQGAFLVGMKDWAEKTDDSGHWSWLLDFAEEQGFRLGDRQYHADDHAVGQYYIALSSQFGLPDALEPVIEQFDGIIANPSSADLDHSIKATNAERALGYSRTCQFRWCWSDALFMSPPTFAALSKATGDPKYLEFADREFFATTDYLFREFSDIPGGIYLRDSTFITDLDANGDLVFWSRGNGWVFGGLPPIFKAMPADFSGRSRFLDVYTDMAMALKATQVTEGQWAGFWGPSLRAFDLFPSPESSGTGFFVGGMAWGIAEGILPAEEYLDVVKSGWNALMSVRQGDGSIGWTQQIGAQPDSVNEGGAQLYGAGSFLQAAAGVLRLQEQGFL